MSRGNRFSFAGAAGLAGLAVLLTASARGNTLTLSGGTLTLASSGAGASVAAINVIVAGTAYTGVGPSSDTGAYWNNPGQNGILNGLLNSSGAVTSVSYTASGGVNNYPTFNPAALLDWYEFNNNNDGQETFTFGGLTPGTQYDLYAISNSNDPGRATTFTTGGTSQTVTTPSNYSTVAVTSSSIYAEFVGLAPNAGNQITITAKGTGTETDVNGFQLVPVYAPLNLPNTNIAVTANSTLDFGNSSGTVTLGGLSLAAALTLQDVAGGGSVQFGGDVLASANAAVVLSAGTGSVPALVLAGSGNVQNIKAANGATLTLPALGISANTINVGSAAGYNGSVVLSGATALTGASAPTLNVNAGSLQVSGTLASSVAGANLQVNSGGKLLGGPAAAIQVPVTVNSGGVLLPDASQASTALIGSSLTINTGGVFQWAYSGPGAEGTLALGSNIFYLPGNGNPVFRPQFSVPPAVGSYVMTWTTPPANKPVWTFDGSQAAAGNSAVWGLNGNGAWDTGTSWTYSTCTGATLNYEPTGLQLSGLAFSNTPGTASPGPGAGVTIAPPGSQSVAVTGPAEPVAPGALVIQGGGLLTASLTLQSSGPLSPTSLSVLADGGLTASAGALIMPTGTLAISGGSVSLGSASTNVGTATITNGVLSLGGGSVGALNANGGATTVAAAAALGAAIVTAGAVNFSNTNAMASLAVSGGTVNSANSTIGAFIQSSGQTTFGPTVSLGTADVSAGAGTVSAPAPLAITSTLKLPAGVTATITGGNSFGVRGANLANISQASTLTLSGGMLTLTPSGQGTIGAAINVVVGGTAYTGVGPSSDTGTFWNNPGLNGSETGLKNSSGATTNVSYSASGGINTWNTEANPTSLLNCYSFSYTGAMTFTFGGLTPGQGYDLYAICQSNAPGRATTFITAGSSQTVTTAANFATTTVTSTSTYTEFVGLTAKAGGQIVVTATSASTASGSEVDVNGFQLVPAAVSAPLNLPNTNIAATASSVLDFGNAGSAVTLGGLSLAGTLTLQDVAGGGSVQFGGDVLASANAAVVLSAGTGSVPALVLAGSGNVQNIKAANGATLTLPALGISANTINVGSAAGYNGSVVLSGATALTGASAPTLNVNAGSLQVSGTLASSVAGANLQVNSGGKLVGGPAASIQVPVTVNSGGVLVPDASQASTALIGSSLTINAGGVFQWAYSGPGAEGTLALGSNVLNLPASGNPVFRPQFSVPPTVGSYIMTWTSPPANKPAWTFDGSLVAAGNSALWGLNGSGTWDTGASWNYPSYTGATLNYEPTGLQLSGLAFSNTPGTASPGAGAGVTIAPPGSQNVAVTGPAEPVAPGALVIQGSGSLTASLTLQSSGPISPASVSVLPGGGLTASAAGLIMPAGTLAISGGSVSLGNASTNVGTTTITGGVLSLGGGSLGALNVNGGSTTVVAAATVGSATVNGGTLTAGAAFALSSNSAVTVNGGLLNVAAGPQTVGSLTIGSLGTLNLNAGNLLTSTHAASFAGTLNISGATGPGELMAYGSYGGGTFTTVNGLPSGDRLAYNGNQLDVVAAPAINASRFLVSNYNTNTIEAYSSTGADLGLFASTGLSEPQGLAFDRSGNLYVANWGTNTIEKFSASGTDLGVFASTGLSSPCGLAFDSRGNLYVANWTSSTIEEFSSTGQSVAVISGTGLNHPGGIAIDSSGNIYAANWGTNTVEKFSSIGTDLGVFASSNLNHPAGLAFDSAGDLYAANYWGTTIEEFSPSGTDLGAFASGLDAPDGLAFDSNGNLYEADQNTNTIVELGSNGLGSVFASSGMNSPDFIAVQTPEPGSIALLLAGAVAFGIWRLRRKACRS